MKVLVQSQQASAELIKMFEELFLRYGELSLSLGLSLSFPIRRW